MYLSEHIKYPLSLPKIIITRIIKYIYCLYLLQTILLKIRFSKKLINLSTFDLLPKINQLVCLLLIQYDCLEVLNINKTFILHYIHDLTNTILLTPEEYNAILN